MQNLAHTADKLLSPELLPSGDMSSTTRLNAASVTAAAARSASTAAERGDKGWGAAAENVGSACKTLNNSGVKL